MPDDDPTPVDISEYGDPTTNAVVLDTDGNATYLDPDINFTGGEEDQGLEE